MITRKKCTLCGAENNFKTRYNLPKFNIVECKKCHLRARSIIFSKKEIKDLYSKDYFCKLQKEYFSAGITKDIKNSLRVEDFKDRFTNILTHTKIKKGSLLDLGCGTGVFLKIVKDQNWKTTGVEVSKYASEIAKKKFNLDVSNKELKDSKFKNSSFDVITGWDLIEHVEEPGDLMAEINRITKKRGFVAFQTTMVDSTLFVIADITYRLSLGKFKKLVEIAYPIHHSNHFSRNTLKKLLTTNGYKVIFKKNAEMFYEETSLPKIFLPALKVIGVLSQITGKTIELYIIGQKKPGNEKRGIRTNI